MRILYYPVYSNHNNLNGCYVYNTAKTLIRDSVMNLNDVFWYWILPKRERNEWKYKEEPEFMHLPRVSYNYLPQKVHQGDELPLLPDAFIQKFSKSDGDIPWWDVLLTGKPNIMPFLVYQMMGRCSLEYLPVTQTTFLQKHTVDRIPPEGELAQLTGYILSKNIFSSKRQFYFVKELARKYFSPYAVEMIERNSVVIYPGIQCDELDKHAKTKKENISVVYPFRTHTKYRPEEVFKVIDQIFCTGRQIRARVVSPAGKGGKLQKATEGRYRYFAVSANNPQKTYWHKVSRCHVFLSATLDSEFSLTIPECLYLCVIGILPNVTWVKEQLPGYKFLYKDNTEAAHLLRLLVDKWHTPLVQDELKKWKKILKQDFDAGNQNLKMMDQIYDWYIELRKEVKRKIIFAKGYKLTKDVVAFLGEQFSAREFCDILTRFSTSLDLRTKGTSYRRTNALSFTKYLPSLDYIDNCQMEEPYYERCKSDEGSG